MLTLAEDEGGACTARVVTCWMAASSSLRLFTRSMSALSVSMRTDLSCRLRSLSDRDVCRNSSSISSRVSVCSACTMGWCQGGNNTLGSTLRETLLAGSTQGGSREKNLTHSVWLCQRTSSSFWWCVSIFSSSVTVSRVMPCFME
jgi:hypothetical protein